MEERDYTTLRDILPSNAFCTICDDKLRKLLYVGMSYDLIKEANNRQEYRSLLLMKVRSLSSKLECGKWIRLEIDVDEESV
ncbi:hypothetical protein P5F12_13360 [Clostridium perfringens]|nr:hypothetical protein [Clostridium perfringens]